MTLPRRRLVAVLIALATFAVAGVAFAQRGFRGGSFREGSFPYIAAPDHIPDGSFVICRLAYSSISAEESGIGCQTDYP